jgi:hypothetical protein
VFAHQRTTIIITQQNCERSPTSKGKVV